MLVPTFLLLNVWLKLAVSPLARLPVVMVGIAAELAVPSYVLLSVAAVTVIARPVMTPVLTLLKVTL